MDTKTPATASPSLVESLPPEDIGNIEKAARQCGEMTVPSALARPDRESHWPDTEQVVQPGRSVFEPDEIRRYRRQIENSTEDAPGPEPDTGKPEATPTRILSRFVPTLPGRKKRGLDADRVLYESLQDAVGEGNTSSALKFARRANRRLAGGDIMVANALHRLPYSGRVERLLRNIERRSRTNMGAAEAGILLDLAGSFADKKREAAGVVTIPERASPERVQQIALGTGNIDATEATEDTRRGIVIRLPQPVRSQPEREPAPLGRRVLVAAAGIAALVGSMSMMRGVAEEGPQRDVPPAAAAAPPTTASPESSESGPIVIDAPTPEAGPALNVQLVSDIEETDDTPHPDISPTTTTTTAPVQLPVAEAAQPPQTTPVVNQVPDTEPTPTPDPNLEPSPPEPQPEQPQPEPEPPVPEVLPEEEPTPPEEEPLVETTTTVPPVTTQT